MKMKLEGLFVENRYLRRLCRSKVEKAWVNRVSLQVLPQVTVPF